MAFLNNYDHDIFISYAHVDNNPLNGHWVAELEKHLKQELNARIGRNSIDIWRDTRLEGNHFFDNEIVQKLEKSALLVVLLSHGYLHQDSYCKKELEYFYQKKQQANAGNETKSRIFNVLLYNLPPESWPPACAGSSGFKLYDTIPPKNIDSPSSINKDLFKQQVLELAISIHKTLTEIAGSKPEEIMISNSKKVYFAEVADSLLEDKYRVVAELRQKGVDVIDTPAIDLDTAKYEQKVVESAQRAGLCIHLLDEVAGRRIPNSLNTYIQRQVELLEDLNLPQFIWVPRDYLTKEYKNPTYRQFIENLENKPREDLNYSFIEGTVSEVAEDIMMELTRQDEIALLNAQKLQEPAAVFLDTHKKDAYYAMELYNYFHENKLSIIPSPQDLNPEINLPKYERSLKSANALVLVSSDETQNWVLQRLFFIIQVIIKSRHDIECGIYLAPFEVKESKKVKDFKFYERYNFLLLDNSEEKYFKPDVIEPLMNKIKIKAKPMKGGVS